MDVATVEFIDPREPVAVSFPFCVSLAFASYNWFDVSSITNDFFLAFSTCLSSLVCLQEHLVIFMIGYAFVSMGPLALELSSLFIASVSSAGCSNIKSWSGSGRVCIVNFASDKDVPFG